MSPLKPMHSFTFNSTVVNIYHVNKGEGLAKHEHTFAHVTVCYSGRVLITKENARLEMTKDTQPVTLKENEWHELEALEDGTCFSNIFQNDGSY